MIVSRGLVGPKPDRNGIRAKGKQVNIPAPRATLPIHGRMRLSWSTAVAVSKAITPGRIVMMRTGANAERLPFGGVPTMPGARENLYGAIVRVRT
jgi:hypothetical protein